MGKGILHGGETLDAEIMEARRALEEASKLAKNEQHETGRSTTKINLFLDSQQAHNAIRAGISE